MTIRGRGFSVYFSFKAVYFSMNEQIWEVNGGIQL